MYKIFVSATAYDSGKSGISVYINNVLKELAQEHQLEVIAFRDDIELLPESENIKYLIAASFLRKPLINMLWHLFILPWTLKWKKYDFILLPAANRRLLRFCRKFTIAVVHDLSQYHVEQKYDFLRMFYCKKVLPFYLKRVNRVVAVSGSTATDLERFWKIPASRIKINYNGFDGRNFNSKPLDRKEIPAKFKLEKKYIFYVSRIEHPGKNHLNLIKAYEALPEKIKSEYDLVLAGSFWPGSEAVKAYAEQSSMVENIKFIGFVKHEELASLYHNCSLYIFPSLFEGFGLSLLEAMACGVPVACSKTSSLGEIAADAALLFDPGQVSEISSAMRDILGKPALREKLVKLGFERLKAFDWGKHAAEIIKLYENGSKAVARNGIFDCCVRGVEWLLALVICMLISLPVLCLALCRRIFIGKKIFSSEKMCGKNECVLTVRRFNFNNIVLRNAALFYYVLIFDLRLVGVSIRLYPEENRQTGDSDLFLDCPGIFSLWFLRMSRGIAYRGRLATELEYVNERSFWGDIMIILRSFPALVFYNGNVEFPAKINLLDVEFDNMGMTETIAAFAKDIDAGEQKKVYFVNSDCFNKAVNDRNYLDLLRKGDYILPDGIGVLLACKMLGLGLKENVNGTDLLPFLCKMACSNDYSVFLFGAKPGVAALTRQKLKEVYPSLRIVGERDGYLTGANDESKLLNELNELKPDILLVALGVPAQEKWIAGHCDELTCRLLIGVGGLFDFYSGNIKRAPRWLREIGLEWVFRAAMEPVKKFKRYAIGNNLFIWRVFRWKQNRGR